MLQLEVRIEPTSFSPPSASEPALTSISMNVKKKQAQRAKLTSTTLLEVESSRKINLTLGT
jgi:hypothetical protein